MARRKEDHFGPHDACLGIDVGKSFHWAFALGASGEVLIDQPLSNRQADVDALVAEAGAGALVVVRKRLGVIYAVMRDRVPYVEPAAPVENSGQVASAEPQSPA